jgi:hypothetical protein
MAITIFCGFIFFILNKYISPSQTVIDRETLSQHGDENGDENESVGIGIIDSAIKY